MNPPLHKAASTVATATFAIGMLSAAGPAVAAATPDTLTFVCLDPVACLQAINAGSGQGVLVKAQHNSGLTGTTYRALAADPGDAVGIGGIVGLDLSVAPHGQTNVYTAAVFGRSINGEGTLSVSHAWNGAVGVTFNQGLTTGNFTNGVVGLDNSTDNSGYNDGVLGASGSGYGASS